MATTFIPSGSNLQGGLAALITTLGVGYLTNAGYLGIAAAAIGLSGPQGVATMAAVSAGIIGAVVNVAITHVAELKKADDTIKAIQAVIPNTYAQYPVDKNTPAGTPNNLKGTSGV